MELAAREVFDKRSTGAPEIRDRALLLVIPTVLPPHHVFQLKELENSARGDG
jgi:hypothetical protein